MERYSELKKKFVASQSDEVIVDETFTQSISEFNDILNSSNKALSAARDDLNVLIPLFTKYVLSDRKRTREVSIPVFAKLQNCVTENVELKNKKWWKEYKGSFENNCKTLLDLKNKDCAEWPTIWCMLVRLLGNDIHSSIALTNSLLKIVEKALKDKSENQDKERKLGFNCWEAMVDGFALSKEQLSKRRVEFLLLPLKAPNHLSKVVCETKLQVWLYTLTKMGNKDDSYIDIVLPPFIEFMFFGNKLMPAAAKLLSASRCADEFITILKMTNIFKRQAVLLVATTATCMETVEDNPQLVRLVWAAALDAVKKLLDNIGADNPESDAVLNELISVLDKLSLSLSRSEFVEIILMCIQGKYKLLPLKNKFQMLIEITLKPKIVEKLEFNISSVIKALLCLYGPKERSEKIFTIALDAFQVAATNTENNGEMTNILDRLVSAWIEIIDPLIESVQWILSENANQFICSYLLFPVKYLLKDEARNKERILISWKKLLSSCLKTSDLTKKNIINELIKKLSSLDNELYSSSLEVMNAIIDVCESFDAIPYYSGLMDGLLKKSHNDTSSSIMQSLLESMLKYAKKNSAAAPKLLEIANQISSSNIDFRNSAVGKNLSKFHNSISLIQNITPEKSSKFLHRLAKAKEIQSQNNNRSPSSSPVGLFQFNSIEKKKSSPSIKTSRKTIDEESSQEFVMVPPKPKKTVLTNHQKERLSTRRCDIPALYQDLSQDTQSMDSILNAAALHGQDKNIAVDHDKLTNKDNIIQSLCEDAVSFDCSKPDNFKEPTVEERNIKLGKDRVIVEVVEETPKLEELLNKSECLDSKARVEGQKNDGNTIENVKDNNTLENVSGYKQKSDEIASEMIVEVCIPSKLVDTKTKDGGNIDEPLTISQEMKTDGYSVISKDMTDKENLDDSQKIEISSAASDLVTAVVDDTCKENSRKRKILTPVRKSVRKNNTKLSPNRIQLGKRRSLTITGNNSNKALDSPVISKKVKLQSRKSIAVEQPDSKQLSNPKPGEKLCDDVKASEIEKYSESNLVGVIEKEEFPDSADKETSNEDNSAGQCGKSVSKRRKKQTESTNCSESIKSPTIKKRLRKSLVTSNDPQTISKVENGIASKKVNESRVEIVKIEIDKSENIKIELSDVTSKNENTSIKNENSEISNVQSKLIASAETVKAENNSASFSDNVSSQIVSSAQDSVDQHALENARLSNKSLDVTPKRHRLTPRISSKKKSPCSCCSEENLKSSRVKRKDSLSRSLFEQSSPPQKNKRKNGNSIESRSKIMKESNKSVLTEIDCLQPSNGDNAVICSSNTYKNIDPDQSRNRGVIPDEKPVQLSEMTRQPILAVEKNQVMPNCVKIDRAVEDHIQEKLSNASSIDVESHNSDAKNIDSQNSIESSDEKPVECSEITRQPILAEEINEVMPDCAKMEKAVEDHIQIELSNASSMDVKSHNSDAKNIDSQNSIEASDEKPVECSEITRQPTLAEEKNKVMPDCEEAVEDHIQKELSHPSSIDELHNSDAKNIDSQNSIEASDEKPVECSEITRQPILAEEKNKVMSDCEEAVEDHIQKEFSNQNSIDVASHHSAENIDSKNCIEAHRSKSKNKGLDSWIIRSPRVDRDSLNNSVNEEKQHHEETILEVHAASDSDDSFIVSSQQPPESLIKLKKKDISIVEKEVPNELVSKGLKYDEKKNSPEKYLPSDESSKATADIESTAEIDSKQINVESENKSELPLKSHVCRRLLDNLESNNEETQIVDENVEESECDLSFINDEKYCQVISYEVVDEVQVAVDHDDNAFGNSSNIEREQSAHINSDIESKPGVESSLDECVNKSNGTKQPVLSSIVNEDNAINNNCSRINDLSAIRDASVNKKPNESTQSSPKQRKEEKVANSSLAEENEIHLSPSRALKIKRMVLENARNSHFKSPMTKTEVELTNNLTTPERNLKGEELNKVTPLTAFNIKQSSPEQSSNASNKPKSNTIFLSSPSRAMRIKRLIHSKSSDQLSTEEIVPGNSSPKKVAKFSPEKISIEPSCVSPSKAEKPLSDCLDQSTDCSFNSPEKSINSDNTEKNNVSDGSSCVTSSPQSARGRTAQLMELVNGDSPAQFRRHQQTPRRIRPIRIMTAPESSSPEGEDWVCRNPNPSLVLPPILKSKFKSDDTSPQSSPGISKSKVLDDLSEISPPVKKKRVNFRDPPSTGLLIFQRTGFDGKIISRGNSAEGDSKSLMPEAVTETPMPSTTVQAAEESSFSSNANIGEKKTFGDSTVNSDPELPSSCSFLKSIWKNANKKEKSDFILNLFSESEDLLDVLENVDINVRKQIFKVMCNNSEFISHVSKENIVVQSITQDIELLSKRICKLDDDSQLKLLKSVNEQNQMSLLNNFSFDKKVNILASDLCSNSKLLKELHKKIKLEDLAGEMASQLESSSDLGEMILEKADINKVADLLISGINILKMKR